MEKINKAYAKNRKERGIANKKPLLKTNFASILKLGIAIALILILAFIAKAGDVIIENGKLDVIGEIRSSSGGFIFPDGTTQTTAASWSGNVSGPWANSSANIYNINIGNVGIGTVNPSQKLVVIGTANITQGLNVTGGLRVSELNSAGCDVKSDANGNFYCGTDSGGGGSPGPWNSSGANVYLNNSNAKVGIGIISPGAKLEVNGVINATCPSGMLDARSFCIDASERSATTWFGAIDICGDLGRKLCSPFEWNYACNNLALNQETDNWEWTDERINTANAYVLGNGDCNTDNSDGDSASRAYRCCIDKKLSSD